jgi:uncharacterized protein YkwD
LKRLTLQRGIVAAIVAMLLVSLFLGSVLAQTVPTFADSAMQRVWEASDKPVADGTVRRSWLWGPAVADSVKVEVYKEAPASQRTVQYFDKSRMEITNPSGDKSSQWFVTNGLLVKELCTGLVQIGDNEFLPRTPSEESVGGDPRNPGPVYATFSSLITQPSNAKSGNVSERIDRAGNISGTTANLTSLAKFAYFEPVTGHNIPDVFWQYLQNLPGTTWLFAMGYPVSEPYWATFTVAGKPQELLVQLYERRVLTFNPANAPEWQVEMGNIGQHYYNWRYTEANGGNPTAPGNTTPAPGTTPPSTSPTPPSTGTTPPTGSLPNPLPGMNEEEKKFLDLINRYRLENKLSPLQPNQKLQDASRWHSEDMATLNYFGHIDSKGRDYPKRLQEFGYTDTPVNENIAAGGAAQIAFDTWKNSAGYNAIMLNPELKSIGVGFAYNEKATYKFYWVTDFGGK